MSARISCSTGPPSPSGWSRTRHAAWDPVLDLLPGRVRRPLHPGRGRHARRAAARHAVADAPGVWPRRSARGRRAPFRLAALNVMTTLTGSALLALAVLQGRMTRRGCLGRGSCRRDVPGEPMGPGRRGPGAPIETVDRHAQRRCPRRPVRVELTGLASALQVSMGWILTKASGLAKSYFVSRQ